LRAGCRRAADDPAYAPVLTLTPMPQALNKRRHLPGWFQSENLFDDRQGPSRSADIITITRKNGMAAE